MAHAHELRAFRWLGGVNFKSNIQKIWVVLAFLSLITIIEVVLGIYKPGWMMKPLLSDFDGDGFFIRVLNFIIAPLSSMKFLNFVFIFLTLVKAYYIDWDFMHLRDEKKMLRRAIVWTPIFLVVYLVAILLTEADYIYTVFKTGFLAWDF